MAAPVDVNDPRIIRMRTFSKAYGMAGARVGYALGHPDIIKSFDKVRNHFGMCRISQAGALAALRDQWYLKQTVGNVAAGRARIQQIALSQGLEIVPSATNFVAIDCGQDGVFAKAVLDALVERDIFVRMPFVAPEDRCIRISCGRPQDLELLAQTLRQSDYTVSEHYDLNKRGFEAVMREMLFEVEFGAEVLVFYAGHGVQVGGRNYILPTDSNVLFWSVEQRDAAFRQLDAIPVLAKANVIASGDTVRELPKGDDLVIPTDVDQYMTEQRTAALVILLDGEIVYERYGLDFGPEGKWTSFSVAKRFTSTLVGAAVKDGHIII